MKKISIKIFLLTLLLAWAVSGPAAAGEFAGAISVFKASPEVQPFFKNCYALAIFPTVGKAAVVVGGAYGEGKVYRQGKLTGNAKLVHASFSLQLGGKTFSEIIFLQDKQAYDAFTSGEFEFDADVSANAITAGAQARTEYRNGMAAFIYQKEGLMAAMAIGGQKFGFEPR